MVSPVSTDFIVSSDDSKKISMSFMNDRYIIVYQISIPYQGFIQYFLGGVHFFGIAKLTRSTPTYTGGSGLNYLRTDYTLF